MSSPTKLQKLRRLQDNLARAELARLDHERAKTLKRLGDEIRADGGTAVVFRRWPR